MVPESALARSVRKTEERGPSIFSRFLSSIGSLTAGNNDKGLTKLLTTAGYRGQTALFTFVGLRTILSVGPALIYLIPRISRGEPFVKTIGLALFIWAIAHLVVMTFLLAVLTAGADSLQLNQGLPFASVNLLMALTLFCVLALRGRPGGATA